MTQAVLVVDKNKKESLIHKTKYAELAKWIVDGTQNGNIFPHEKIAKKIIDIREDRWKKGMRDIEDDPDVVMEKDLVGWITGARKYTELYLNCTLQNVRGQGWRASTERETAFAYAHTMRKTLSWAVRCERLGLIANPKYIPDAIKEVFSKAEGLMHRLSTLRTPFGNLFTQIAERKKKNEQRLLSHAK